MLLACSIQSFTAALIASLVTVAEATASTSQVSSSNIFPKQTIAIRPDVHIMVSSGIFSNNTKRQSVTTAPVFELSYTRNGFRSFQKNTYSCCSFKSDAREESIINKLDLSLIKETNQINRLLLESYILELLSINIERLICKDNSKEYVGRLSRADMDRLTYAREILLNRLESPPTLLELSRIIHMNDCKLKRSFKQYFGKTVYEFIRE